MCVGLLGCVCVSVPLYKPLANIMGDLAGQYFILISTLF